MLYGRSRSSGLKLRRSPAREIEMQMEDQDRLIDNLLLVWASVLVTLKHPLLQSRIHQQPHRHSWSRGLLLAVHGDTLYTRSSQSLACIVMKWSWLSVHATTGWHIPWQIIGKTKTPSYNDLLVSHRCPFWQ